MQRLQQWITTVSGKNLFFIISFNYNLILFLVLLYFLDCLFHCQRNPHNQAGSSQANNSSLPTLPPIEMLQPNDIVYRRPSSGTAVVFSRGSSPTTYHLRTQIGFSDRSVVTGAEGGRRQNRGFERTGSTTDHSPERGLRPIDIYRKKKKKIYI